VVNLVNYLVNYYYNFIYFWLLLWFAHGLLFGPAIKHLKASQGCAGGPGLCAFFSGGLEPGYNCTQQTLHYSVEHGDLLCFFLNLKNKK